MTAPELAEHQGNLYRAALLPSLKGIQITKLIVSAEIIGRTDAKVSYGHVRLACSTERR